MAIIRFVRNPFSGHDLLASLGLSASPDAGSWMGGASTTEPAEDVDLAKGQTEAAMAATTSPDPPGVGLVGPQWETWTPRIPGI